MHLSQVAHAGQPAMETAPNLSGPAPAPAAVAQLLATIFRGRRVVNMERLAEGLCNFNYKIDFDPPAEPVVLRIYGRDPAACRKEADLLRLLHDPIPVPEVLHVNAQGCNEVGPFIVMRYVAGLTFRQLKRTGAAAAIAQAAAAIGETLAAIGRYTCPLSSTLATGPAVNNQALQAAHAIPEMIDASLASPTLCARLDARARACVHALVCSRAEDLARLQTETRLVHRDFNNRNILVRETRGRWTVAAVLDWEFAVSGSPMFDIASFLQYERRHSPVREPHFSLGYERGGGRLPAGWWQLARIINLASQCETLTRMDVPPALIAEVAELVRATVEEYPMAV
ncbi:MAG: phosphotransferase family protein [Pyrinomonadaceae bacterium]